MTLISNAEKGKSNDSDQEYSWMDTFTWTFNGNGMPIKLVITEKDTYSTDVSEKVFEW